MTNNVIIVAGGKGLRMGKDLPKQFIVVGDKPILMHTIEAFFNFDNNINIVVVLPPAFKTYWKNICHEYGFNIPYSIAEGGETRFHSVKNGLSIIKDGIVAVHDGARPFTSVALIKRTFQLTKKHKAVIPVVDSTDSLRQVTGENGESVIIDRSTIKLVQTPQVFTYETLKSAYNADFSDIFTDDASVVEMNGDKIFLTEGEVTNIKITTPLDLAIAEIIIKQNQEKG